MPNTLEGVTALQSDIAARLRNAGIPEEFVSTILIAIAAGEEARARDEQAITALALGADLERCIHGHAGDILCPHCDCPHGFILRYACPTCNHFDEIESRERRSPESHIRP